MVFSHAISRDLARLRAGETHRDLFALPLEEMTPAAFKKTLA